MTAAAATAAPTSLCPDWACRVGRGENARGAPSFDAPQGAEWGWVEEGPHHRCPGCKYLSSHRRRAAQGPEEHLLERDAGGCGSHYERDFHCLVCHTTWQEMYQMDEETFGAPQVFEVELGYVITEKMVERYEARRERERARRAASSTVERALEAAAERAAGSPRAEAQELRAMLRAAWPHVARRHRRAVVQARHAPTAGDEAT